ncbi:MAG: DEAD/DEAH box helicase, partial [Bacteroidota bacterium]
EIPHYQNELAGKIESILGEKLTINDAEAILNKRDFIVEMLGILKNEKIYDYFKHIMQYPEGDPSTLWLSNTERVLMECYKGLGPEMSLKSNELGKFQETLQRHMDARSSLLRLIRWGLFSKDKYWTKRVLVENQLKRNKEGFNSLVEKIDNRLNLEHNITKLKNQDWLIDIPDTYQKVHFQNWFYLKKLAVKSKTIFTSLRNFKEYFNPQKLTYEDLKKKLEDLFVLIKEIPEKKQRWNQYLTDSQLNTIINNPTVVEKFKSTLRTDFDSLCDFDSLKEEIHPNQMKAIDRLMEAATDSEHETLESLFQNSLRLAWIEHIETKYPLLRSVSSLKFHQMEADLQNNVSEKLALSNDMLLLRARERTYEKVEYNRLKNVVTYRDLLHQVTKKRRVWPLRKVIATFDMELFDLIPCWLASPESVSAIFPMKEMFDLVIFDEASQCFVERGIPAMYRGRQIVIAGDDKQLRPSDLYQVRFEDESEDLPELEIDSLLDLAKHHLLGLQLKGHYRSKSLDLIDFSNRHFYDGNLKLLPDFNVVNSQIPAIDYVKVDGIWDKNINREEALKVVELLKDIAKTQPDKDVGVVTFNAKQQQHILDVIDEKTMTDGWTFPESWFVKNIENVQGDEKDIIVFSTAYAPDEKGKMSMQFGSLNAVGGENRLNVAITRAQEKIIIVSSILPPQLQVEDSKNDGPKLLKKYLEYALEVSSGNFTATLPPEPVRNQAWYLKSRVINWSSKSFDGYNFNQELPFADVTIKRDGKYVGLMLTDDNLYYQSLSVKDMHVYTPFVLTKKKWKFKTLFSREVWNNEEQVEEVITRFVTHHAEE